MNDYNPKARNSAHSGSMNSGAGRQVSNSVTPTELGAETHRETHPDFNRASIGSGPQTYRHYGPTPSKIGSWSGPVK